MIEKEANANNLNVQNQRRKIFEQEEMEEAQIRREATADVESEEGKITRKGENTLQNKRKNIEITKTAAKRIGNMEAIIDEMENEVLKIESLELRSKEFDSRKMRSEIEKLQIGLEMLVLSKSEELKTKADLEGIFNTMCEIIKLT